MANKNTIQNINFNGYLNLNKYKCEIKNFDGFNEKNASIFGGVLTPYFKQNYNEKYFGLNNKIYHVDEDYSYDKIALYSEDKLVSTLPKYSISKETFNINNNILAFEFDKSDTNLVHLFVEGETTYQFIDYNLSNNQIVTTYNTSLAIGNSSNFNMRDGNVVFYSFVDGKIHIINKNHSWSTSYVSAGTSPICTFNKLDSSFNVNPNTPRYLITYCGISGNLSQGIAYRHVYVVYFGVNNTINATEVTLVSSGLLNDNQIPKFAPNVYDDNPTFYYVTDIENINNSTSSSPITVYMTATPTSLDTTSNELTVTCANPITVKNSEVNTNNKCSAEITPYFCSIMIGCSQNSNNVYFDSIDKSFIGNTGYIETINSQSGTTARVNPFGHKIDFSDMSLNYKFSILMNYTNITNMSVTLNSAINGNRQSNIGTVFNEWNSIDNNANICVDGYRCMFKNTDNTVSVIEIKMSAPKYKIILDRYIVFETPHYINIFDTEKNTFYHSFNDYNNRMMICEKYGDTSIADFPSGYTSGTPYTYLYASAINANMEVSNVNISSIQYNPSVIQNGIINEYKGKFVECGETRYNEKVDIYYDASNTATTAIYQRSFTTTMTFFDNSLNLIPYPITSNGNILYSSNLFSQFINSYSNKDFIINNTVGYPLTYINNKPTLSYYFLSGIESINSAFILQGINYVNTDNYIFQLEYNADVIGYSSALVNIQGFKFIGNSTKCAFYYSPLTKCIYGFFGDRTLNKLLDCSDIGDIKYSFFNPKEYKIYVVTENNIIVVDDETTFSINIPNVTNISFTDDFIIINNGNKSVLLSYHSKTNKQRLPIKLQTQYYGMGNNIKSVIDCIYIRLFYDYDDSFNVKDNIVLKVNTLTDCGRQSEEKTISVQPSDWDKETKTLYIRYQPKYQECVGMEVSVESPFAIASLDFGYSTDGSVQVSKFNA